MAKLNNKDYLLAELRCAALRSRQMTADIESVGVALKDGFMTADEALMILRQSDLLGWFSSHFHGMLKQQEQQAERAKAQAA